jgi:succinylglutamate desuccinylase
MEENLLKQQKEVDKLKMDNANAYQVENEIQRQADQRHAHMDQKLQKQMGFNEKLNKLLEETQKKKPSIMILFLEKIVNSISKIFCFK